MKKLLKTLCICALVLVCIYSGATTVSAANARTGKCGNKLNYSLSDSGVLTIWGTGNMWDFRNDPGMDYHENPWENLKQEIKKVVFKPGITYVGVDAFSGCENLTQVTFTHTITSIGCFSFLSCSNLENFELPPKLKTLGQQAFDGCAKITKVKIPDTVTFLDSQVFNHCSSLTDLYIGGSKDVGSYVYASSPLGWCSALKEVKVSPNNIALTAVNGVLYNKEVTTLLQYPAGKRDKTYTVPATVERIEQFSADSNPYIETIIFPKSLNSIGVLAFWDCENLKEVYYAGTKTQWNKVYVDPNNDELQKATIYYGKGCQHKYSNLCDTTCNICYGFRKDQHTYKKGSCTRCNYTPVGVKITNQPVSVKVAKGAIAKVSFKAVGDGLTYRWYYKDKGSEKYTYIASFTGNSYVVAMNDARNGRIVLCRVYDKYGNVVQTKSVKLSMAAPVKITKQPVSVKVAKGATAKVSFTAVGDGLTYRWYYKDKGSKNYTYTDSFKSRSYSVTMNDARNGRIVLCRVYDKYGNVVQTKSVKLSMAAPVKITKQPVSVKVANGAAAKVSFTAVGDGLTYRWYYKDKGSKNYTYTDSFKSNSYSVTMNNARNGRIVLCRVYDKYGNVAQTKSVTISKK